ncbi:MAG: hypothetical protein KDC95_23315, partial [Planctomycetes bacterium]|nr:hypothetical protein [Planctomycetota bacterium]
MGATGEGVTTADSATERRQGPSNRVALAALLALGALAAGCGGDDEGVTTPGVTGAQPPPPPTTPPVET